MRLVDQLGWRLFLDGKIEEAVQVWKTIPPAAQQIAEAYNRALAAAKAGDKRAAIQHLRSMPPGFRPAAALREQCLVTEGTSALPRNQPVAWRRTAAVAVLLVAVVASSATGWIVGSSSRDGAVEPPPPVPPTGTNADVQVVSAFAAENFSQLLEGLHTREITAEPSPELDHVPEPARSRVSRLWYLEGLTLHGSGDSSAAADALTAAILTVGGADQRYWVDDALYLLALSTKDIEPSMAREAAALIVQHHPQSIYNNSLIKAIGRAE